MKDINIPDSYCLILGHRIDCGGVGVIDLDREDLVTMPLQDVDGSVEFGVSCPDLDDPGGEASEKVMVVWVVMGCREYLLPLYGCLLFEDSFCGFEIVNLDKIAVEDEENVIFLLDFTRFIPLQRIR